MTSLKRLKVTTESTGSCIENQEIQRLHIFSTIQFSKGFED